MSYSDPDFWERYQEFALGSRSRHRLAYSVLTQGVLHLAPGARVLDLGCGHAFIGHHVAAPDPVPYLGVDLDPGQPPYGKVVKGDYRDRYFLERKIQDFQPTTMVSFFSTDVILPIVEAHALYKELLTSQDNVTSIFTAGFYYDDKRRNDEIVEEAGSLTSYQVPRGRFLDLPGISAKRLEIPAPSEMFGPCVVEVFTYYCW